MIIDSFDTLKKMTGPEIFEHVAVHLLTQRDRSTDGFGLCCYRDSGGLACAVGCLIPDEIYKPAFEENPVQDLIVMMSDWSHKYDDAGKVKAWAAKMRLYRDVLEGLQDVHDYKEPTSWREELRILSDKLDRDDRNGLPKGDEYWRAYKRALAKVKNK